MSQIQYIRMGARALTSHPGAELINLGIGILLEKTTY